MRKRDKKKKAKKLRSKRMDNEIRLRQEKRQDFSDATFWNIWVGLNKISPKKRFNSPSAGKTQQTIDYSRSI